MNSRITRTLIVAGAVVGVACIDMSAPKGPASISVLLLPSPSVVAGDVMRDSNGVPAPLGIIAYDANGKPIAGLSTQFFITDSVRFAHVDASDVLVGDQVGTVHLLGQIGALQTGIAAVPITPVPSKFAISGAVDTVLSVPIGIASDSTTSSAGEPLNVSLRSAGDSAVAGFVVKYVIISAPASVSATSPAIYLAVDNSGKPSSVDTTDASGTAGRTLIVNSRRLADPVLQAGTKLDSAIVEASTKYKGILVGGVPVRFVVRFRVVLP